MKKSDFSGKPGTMLMCSDAGECHSMYSADPNNYFMISDDYEFICTDLVNNMNGMSDVPCGAPMVEVEKVVSYREVTG